MKLDGFEVLVGDSLYHAVYGFCSIVRVSADGATAKLYDGGEMAVPADGRGARTKLWFWQAREDDAPPKCSASDWTGYVTAAQALKKAIFK